jgi:hypothetical protein
MLIRISKILALIVLTINISFAGLFNGFEQGYTTNSMFSGFTVYITLSMYYFLITFCVFGFVIGKSIKNAILSQIICFSSLIPTLYFYQKIYFLKNYYFYDVESFSTLIRGTIPIDWFCFLIVLILLAYQIVSAFQHFSSKNYKMN